MERSLPFSSRSGLLATVAAKKGLEIPPVSVGLQKKRWRCAKLDWPLRSLRSGQFPEASGWPCRGLPGWAC